MSGKASRAFRLRSSSHRIKDERVAEILPVWQAGLGRMQAEVARLIFTTGELPKWVDAKGWDGGLSQRQWDSVRAQCIAQHKSWLGNCERVFRQTVAASAITGQVRKDLFSVNKSRAWYLPVEGDSVAITGKRSVPAETMWLARRIMKHVRARVGRPDMRRLPTMVMDGKVAKVETPHGHHGDYWVRIATLTAGKPVVIPLHAHRAFLERLARPGAKLANHCQVHVNTDGTVDYRLVIHTPTCPARTGGREMGIDWGMSTLFATSDGRLHGRGFLDRLRAYDARLQPLMAALQRNGIKLRDSRRYRALVQDVRGFITNEVNRCLNRIIADDSIDTLVVEKLNFQGMAREGRLSKRMRRLLSNTGRGAVNTKLASLAEDHGVATVEVNPAHTSRECTGCGYTSKTNRTTQTTFRCRFCGKTVHADIGGARTVLGRSQNNRHWTDRNRGQILTMLDEDFRSRWGLGFADVAQRRNTRGSRVAPTPATPAAQANALPRQA
ncbi:transposase [Saccharopolyspora sp. WRP15-2]|uniref:Transposase n=1 Tax=Saccharopolyspora oryzae TaxID=2997343 RepID=A0ABT4UV40_9PSEU|nr:transposase [Saccharopolyspora oryzae]MDA3625586.1 transposase [Saccharopolyspora oryzae]